MQRLIEQIEQRNIECTKTRGQMIATLSTIRLYCRSNAEILKVLDRIGSLDPPNSETAKNYPRTSIRDLEAWKTSAVRISQDFVEKQYTSPISELSALLEKEIDRD